MSTAAVAVNGPKTVAFSEKIQKQEDLSIDSPNGPIDVEGSCIEDVCVIFYQDYFGEPPSLINDYKNIKVNLHNSTYSADVIKNMDTEIGLHFPKVEEASAKGTMKCMESQEAYELYCIYFATTSHFLNMLKMEDDKPVIDQILPILIDGLSTSRRGSRFDYSLSFDATLDMLHTPTATSVFSSPTPTQPQSSNSDRVEEQQLNNKQTKSICDNTTTVFILCVCPAGGKEKSSDVRLRRSSSGTTYSTQFSWAPRLNDVNIMHTFVRTYSAPSSMTMRSTDQNDLCALPDLNEKSLLYHVKKRFMKKKFFTYVGTILVSMNPYWMDSYQYSTEMMQRFQMQTSSTGTLSRGLEPHVFAVGDQAFMGMRESKKDQCIVISGESGSGKTVAANEIIRYLMQLANQGDPSTLELMIAHTSPILEAFGNAKTDHNDNSSRHGKYIQIQYKPGGIVNGARVQKYLLEKSRIVQHKKNERNYHVFFYLLACDAGSPDDDVCDGVFEDSPERSDGIAGERMHNRSQFAWLKETLHLTKAADYHYLNRSTLCNDDESDYENFLYLIQSMHELLGASGQRYSEKHQRQGLLSSTIVNVFTVVAAILHLGNVQFDLPESGNLEKDLVQIVNEQHLVYFCELLHLPLNQVRLTLQKRKHKGAAQFTKHNSVRDAENARDTVAKSLYSYLFDWIIRQVNFRMFSASQNDHYFNSSSCFDYSPYDSSFGPAQTDQDRQIGILDIFGFEDIGARNSFEQFCINFANEQLQFYFNDHIFNLEQAEYKNDGIKWDDIYYVNNKPCIELFVKRPYCLFALIDEESSLYNGTNVNLLSKFEGLGQSRLPQSSYFIWRPVKSDKTSFGIKHYAGQVSYSVSEFREKNMEKTNDLLRFMRYHTELFFLKDLSCQSPVGIAGWRTLRIFFQAFSAFRKIAAGKLKIDGENVTPKSDAAKLRAKTTRILLHQRSESVDFSLSPPELSSTFQNRHGSALSTLDPSLLITSTGSPENRMFAEKSLTVPTFGMKKFARLRKIRDQPLHKLVKFYAQDPERINIRRISRNNPLYSSTTSLNLTPQNEQRSSFSMRKEQSGSSVSVDERCLTISSQFTGSLNQLMESLNRCKPSFIRCIRSNVEKIPLKLDEETVMRQLRYTGMLDTIRIRSSGYNVRLPFQDFVKDYRILLANGKDSTRSDVEDLLSCIFTDPNSFQLGNTKVYLREKEHLQLQFFIELKLTSKVQMIQRWWRAKAPYAREQRASKSAIKIQRTFRRYRNRNRKLRRSDTGVTVVDAQQTTATSGERHFVVDSSEMDKTVTNKKSPKRSPKKEDAKKSASDKGKTGSSEKQIQAQYQTSPFSREDQNRTPLKSSKDKNADHQQVVTPVASQHINLTGSKLPAPSDSTNTTSTPGYLMCRKCHRRFPIVGKKDTGQVQIIDCNRCQSPVGKSVKRTAAQELDDLCKSLLPPDKIHKVLLKDPKEINRFTQFLNANMKSLSVNDTSDMIRTLSSLKQDLLLQCGNLNGGRPLTLKYFQLVKLFVDHYDKLTQQQQKIKTEVSTTPDNENSGIKFDKGYLVRTFVGLLTHFEKNQKVDVDFVVKRKRKKSNRVREIKGHQLVEKPHSPQYSCACQRRRVDDFVACTLCSVTIHKMCEGLLLDCKVAKVSQDYSPHKFTHVPLELLYKREDNQVPAKLCDLLSYIESYGLTREGIYRTNGAQMEKKRLLALLDTESYNVEMLNEFDVRTAADVVKFFFRSLPDPLFTYASYQRFLMAMDPDDESERIQIIFQHISKLPPAHYATLQIIILHLVKVADHSAENKMTFSNIATVFAENLMFADTMNLQAGTAMLTTIQKKTQLLILVLEQMSKKFKRGLTQIDDCDRTVTIINERLDSMQDVAANEIKPTDEMAITDAGDDGLLNCNDPKLLHEQRKLTNKIREYIVQEMTTLSPVSESSGAVAAGLVTDDDEDDDEPYDKRFSRIGNCQCDYDDKDNYDEDDPVFGSKVCISCGGIRLNQAKKSRRSINGTVSDGAMTMTSVSEEPGENLPTYLLPAIDESTEYTDGGQSRTTITATDDNSGSSFSSSLTTDRNGNNFDSSSGSSSSKKSFLTNRVFTHLFPSASSQSKNSRKASHP